MVTKNLNGFLNEKEGKTHHKDFLWEEQINVIALWIMETTGLFSLSRKKKCFIQDLKKVDRLK